LQADIEAAQKNMSDMIGRVCATLVRELNACKPETPAWKPEDLIGNLVRAWDNEKEALMGRCLGLVAREKALYKRV